jgi:hypothetical protein
MEFTEIPRIGPGGPIANCAVTDSSLLVKQIAEFFQPVILSSLPAFEELSTDGLLAASRHTSHSPSESFFSSLL